MVAAARMKAHRDRRCIVLAYGVVVLVLWKLSDETKQSTQAEVCFIDRFNACENLPFERRN